MIFERGGHSDPEVILAGTDWPWAGIIAWVKRFQDHPLFLKSDGYSMIPWVAKSHSWFEWTSYTCFDEKLRGITTPPGYREEEIVPYKNMRACSMCKVV